MSSALYKNADRQHKQDGFPTILVVAGEGLRHSLVSSLRWEGYFVLEAKSELEALHVVVSQSRVIHVLVMDVTMNGNNLAQALRDYRCEMQPMFVTDHPSQSHSDALNAATALAEVRKLLELPEGAASSAQGNRRADANLLADFSRTNPFTKLHSPVIAQARVERPVRVPRQVENSGVGHVRAVEAFENTRAFKQAV